MLDAAKTNWVINVGDAAFETEVLERSKSVPVIVDFWAEWCGPCKQFGPILEKIAAEKKGAFVLAKVNVDEAGELASYFRIESIPAVLAFRDGQTVNGFVGLLPEDKLLEFINEIAPGTGATDTPMDAAVKLEATDLVKAEEAYRTILAADAENHQASVGLARVLVGRENVDAAMAVLENLPEVGEVGAEVTRLKRLIEMRKNAAAAGDEADLKKKIAADPENARLRYDLGNVLATKERYEEALTMLLSAAELDKPLAKNEVRELMVKIFEIIGVRSDMADAFRDKLRSILY